MKIILIILAGVILSCFYFPFEFTFMPKGLNTKLMLAGVGVLIMGYHMIQMKSVKLSREITFASLIAIVFSLVGFYSTDYNNSSDYAYATYIGSMWVWLLASYVAVTVIAMVHNKITIRLLVSYLAAVCLAQCILALIIDFVPVVKIFVDRYFNMGITDFLNDVNRLYGIGAALDVAGVRFSAVLIMISVMLVNDPETRNSHKSLYLYFIGFLLIGVIGNMISRTTTVGLGIGLAYLVVSSNIIQARINKGNLRIWKVILVSFLLIVAVGTYLYQTNDEVYSLLRFGFEGFFNWAETGEWRTDSTDRLNTVMWIWPEANDITTWLIGKSLFSNWHDVGTDIGYCRFVFYCGLIGLSVFILFFAYLTYALWNKYLQYKYLFLMLFVLALINWLKVSTDIFLVFAMFLSIGSPYIYNYYYKESKA